MGKVLNNYIINYYLLVWFCSPVLVFLTILVDICLLLLLKIYRRTPQTAGDMLGPIFEAENVLGGSSIFTENLCHPDKGIRISNLKILCHFKHHPSEISAMNQPADVCSIVCNNLFAFFLYFLLVESSVDKNILISMFITLSV